MTLMLTLFLLPFVLYSQGVADVPTVKRLIGMDYPPLARAAGVQGRVGPNRNDC